MSQIKWPEVIFRYHDYFFGPFVEISTKEPEKWGEFLVRCYEKVGDRLELVETATLQGNQFYESNRKFYTNWYIEVLGFQNNKIVRVAWDKFDLFDRNVAIWLQNKHNSAPDINFHQEIIPVIEEFVNKHKCHLTVVSDFAHSLSSSNKDIKFISMLTADDARTNYYATYRIGVYCGEENNIIVPWDDLKTQPVYTSNRIFYHDHHPRNVIALNLSSKEIAHDILFGFNHNDLSYNSYYHGGEKILSSKKQVWVP
jgi:hypothetical protein